MRYCGKLGTEKVYLNFLYSNKNQINKIYKDIGNSKIKCDQEYIDKCIKIKQLFLNKIDKGMSYSEYHQYKNAFKSIKTNYSYITLDTIIDILSIENSTYLEISTIVQLLNEIILLFVYYFKKINDKEEFMEILKLDNYYYLSLELLKINLKNQYEYLNETIYKDIYNNFLSMIEKEYLKYLKSRYNNFLNFNEKREIELTEKLQLKKEVNKYGE